MKHLFLSTVLCTVSMTAAAQAISHTADTASNQCSVIYPPGYTPDKFLQKSSSHVLGFPSCDPNLGDFKFKNEHEYVYRLAVCISPDYFNNYFQGDTVKVSQWLDKLEASLNTFYRRDIGVRFVLVRDNRLLLSSWPQKEGLSSETYFDVWYGTEIINNLIGTENYDTGILIRYPKGSMSGQAFLAGVYLPTSKGNAFAQLSVKTIAHEIGHLFGAEHTHERYDGLYTEPGGGRSIMSYGSPADFFSIPSAVSMRSYLQNQSYYLDAERNPDRMYKTSDYTVSNSNPPYVVPTPGVTPELDRTQIRREYVVTRGTRFQFYLPLENSEAAQFQFAASNYDRSKGNMPTNEMQPAYKAHVENCVMFRPYYEQPDAGATQIEPINGSDNFKPGRYTFALAAVDTAAYDMVTTQLTIVEGTPFKITSSTSRAASQCGKAIHLTWNPCTELYGKDSKVRILLSPDFGTTFPYVLADDLPNNGSWSGFWPYMKIGKAPYSDLKVQPYGGVIKVEVKGEAAFALTHEQPVRMQNTEMVSDGGVELDPTKPYILFDHAPEPFLTVTDESEVPVATKLTARHRTQSHLNQQVSPEERREGCCIVRLWKATLNGTTSTYQQVIHVQRPDAHLLAQAHSEAMDMKRWSSDLYHHLGQLGYPLTGLPQTTAFTQAYEAVYNQDGSIRHDVDLRSTAALKEAGAALDQLQDNQIGLPRERHYYKLRSFNDLFGRYIYRYNRQDTDEQGKVDADVHFVDNEADATVWRCTHQNGQYVFSTPQKTLHLGFINRSVDSIRIDRGYTWGAFTLVEHNGYSAALMNKDGNYNYFTDYASNPQAYRTNRDGMVSSDFQFIPVPFIEAVVPGQSQPDNVLPATGTALRVEDHWKDVYAADDHCLTALDYRRHFTTTEWQPLYLPFALSYADWKDHWEVARIEEVRQVPTTVQRAGERLEVVYRKIHAGQLQPNQPYLVRALTPGEITIAVTDRTFRSTVEQDAEFTVGNQTYHLQGCYTEKSAQSIASDKVSILTDGKFISLNQYPDTQCTFRWTLYTGDAQGQPQRLPDDIRLVAAKNRETVGTLRIGTQEGYGTIYTDVSYELPKDVTSYFVSEADAATGELVLQSAYQGGSVVPAHTPLIVKGNQREYTLFAPRQASLTATVSKAHNLLRGSTTDQMTSAPDETECYFYKLYYATDNVLHNRQLGFYWGAPGGAAFINKAGKAYLALPVAQAVKIQGFLLPSHPTTDIQSLETDYPNAVKNGTYTLTGIKLSDKALKNLPAGVYIINGKKVVVR